MSASKEKRGFIDLMRKASGPERKRIVNAIAAMQDLDGTSDEEVMARLESTHKDAMRYRHMRSNAVFQNRNGPGLYWYLPRLDRGLPVGERLDEAIDNEYDT